MSALTTYRSGAQILPGYQLMRVLGRGGFGEVWRASAPGGAAKAIKLVPHAGDPDGPTAREVEGHRRVRGIRHPSLLPIERIEFVGDTLVVVMELADRNLADLYDERVQTSGAGIPRAELLDRMAEIAGALDTLHQGHGLVHLDVKPENIFLVGGHAKLADFGLVRSCGHVDELAITPAYAAPELFDGAVNLNADQYALATTYQEMLTGKRPYQGTDARAIMVQQLRSAPDVSPLPKSDRDTVRRALHADPDQRFPDCAAFLAALRSAGGFQAAPARMRTPGKTAALPREDHTTALGATKSDTVRLLAGKVLAAASGAQSGTVAAEFVAFLPQDIFACKLRGFIDDMQAETVAASLERTVLRLRPPGWLGGRRAVFVQVETSVRNPHSGYRVVSLSAWSADRKLDPGEWRRRAGLLVRYLKAHLMSVDREPLGNLSSLAVRAAVLHGNDS